MKILIEQSAAKDGFLAVLNKLGHRVMVYEPTTKPPFDAFDEFMPDIYIGLDEEDRPCHRAVNKCLGEYKRIKSFYPTPEFLCAADTINAPSEYIEPSLKADVVFIGDYSPAFDKYIAPLTGTNVKLKVFGRGWNIPEAVGGLALNRAGNALSSAEIALNLEGPGMSPYLYQILISGTCCLSVPLTDCPTKAVEYFSSPKQLVESVAKLLSDNKRRLGTGLAARLDVLDGDTYFHRVAKMFQVIGMQAEAERTLSLHVNQGL
jgi:hypothetical protein